MATTQGEIRVGPQNQVKDVYVRETKKTVTFKILTYLYVSKFYVTIGNTYHYQTKSTDIHFRCF